MLKSFYFILLVLSLSTVYSADILTCTYKLSDTCNDEERLFFASSNLSANVKIDNSLPAYSYSICCKSNATEVKFSVEPKINSTITCPKNSPLLYFTGNTNARVAKIYNASHHNYALCYEVPDKSYALSINFVPKEGLIKDFQCLFRTNAMQNGHISSCDASFNSGNTYQYSVIAQLFAGMDVLSCNFDCSNKLTGRIDYACSLKMPQTCSNVPAQCSSSLPNSWVSYNQTHEVQCSSPWNNYRSKAFTNEALVVETSSLNSCANLIKIPRSVFLNNEVVTMNIYVCQN